MARHFISNLFVFSFTSAFAQNILSEQRVDFDASGFANYNFSTSSQDAEVRGKFIPLRNLGGRESATDKKAASSSDGSRPAGAGKRGKTSYRPSLPHLQHFLPTPLPLISSILHGNQSGKLSGESTDLEEGTNNAANKDQDLENQYASGPISLQHFLKYRNDSVPPFRLESLTADHLRSPQNASFASRNEDHVSDILDRFKTDNSKFRSTPSEQKETNSKELDESSENVPEPVEQSRAPVKENAGAEEHSSKADVFTGSGLYSKFPQTPYSIPAQQQQQTHRSSIHDKTGLKMERNHSLKENAPTSGSPRSEGPFSKLKRGKEKSSPKLKEKKDKETDSKDDNGFRFTEESGSGKSVHPNFEFGDGLGKKAFKTKDRQSSQVMKPSEGSLSSFESNDHPGSPPAPQSSDSESSKNSNSDQEEEIISSKNGMFGFKDSSLRDAEIVTSGNLHRQASGGRGFSPAVGFDVPYHQPPLYPPPYPYPMPFPYPPLPPPPVTCCKTYYPNPIGHKSHLHELYPHSSSNEIENAVPYSSAKSDTASSETNTFPVNGYEIPGEAFCYQEPAMPHPLLLKQMKLQKLLYPFILKKRLFFG